MDKPTYEIINIHLEYGAELTSDTEAGLESQSEAEEICELCRLAAELANPEPVSFTTT